MGLYAHSGQNVERHLSVSFSNRYYAGMQVHC